MEIENACAAAQDDRDIGTVKDEDNGHLIYTCTHLFSLTVAEAATSLCDVRK